MLIEIVFRIQIWLEVSYFSNFRKILYECELGVSRNQKTIIETKLKIFFFPSCLKPSFNFS